MNDPARQAIRDRINEQREHLDAATLERLSVALGTTPPRTRHPWWLAAAAALALLGLALALFGGEARVFAAAPAILAVATTGAWLARWLTPLEPRACPVCGGRVGAPHSRGTCSRECEAVAVTDGGI